MSTRRVKISMSSVYTETPERITSKDVFDSNERVRQEMTEVVRNFERKESQSIKQASKLVLNS